MEPEWLQVTEAVSRSVPSSLALVVLVLAAIGSMAIVVSVKASRRLSALVALVAWLSVLSAWGTQVARWTSIVATGLAVAATAFWLVDRGIPGNRRRPKWFKAYAVGLLLLAIATTVLALHDLS